MGHEKGGREGRMVLRHDWNKRLVGEEIERGGSRPLRDLAEVISDVERVYGREAVEEGRGRATVYVRDGQVVWVDSEREAQDPGEGTSGGGGGRDESGVEMAGGPATSTTLYVDDGRIVWVEGANEESLEGGMGGAGPSQQRERGGDERRGAAMVDSARGERGG